MAKYTVKKRCLLLSHLEWSACVMLTSLDWESTCVAAVSWKPSGHQMASVWIIHDDRGDMVVSSAEQVASQRWWVYSNNCIAAQGLQLWQLSDTPVLDGLALRGDCASAVCPLKLGTHCDSITTDPVPLTLMSIVSSNFMPLQLRGTHAKWFNICRGPHTEDCLCLSGLWNVTWEGRVVHTQLCLKTTKKWAHVT